MSTDTSNLKNINILNKNINAFFRSFEENDQNKIVQDIYNIIRFISGSKNINLKDSHKMSITLFQLMIIINFVSSDNKMNNDFKKFLKRA